MTITPIMRGRRLLNLLKADNITAGEFENEIVTNGALNEWLNLLDLPGTLEDLYNDATAWGIIETNSRTMLEMIKKHIYSTYDNLDSLAGHSTQRNNAYTNDKTRRIADNSSLVQAKFMAGYASMTIANYANLDELLDHKADRDTLHANTDARNMLANTEKAWVKFSWPEWRYEQYALDPALPTSYNTVEDLGSYGTLRNILSYSPRSMQLLLENKDAIKGLGKTSYFNDLASQSNNTAYRGIIKELVLGDIAGNQHIKNELKDRSSGFAVALNSHYSFLFPLFVGVDPDTIITFDEDSFLNFGSTETEKKQVLTAVLNDPILLQIAVNGSHTQTYGALSNIISSSSYEGCYACSHPVYVEAVIAGDYSLSPWDFDNDFGILLAAVAGIDTMTLVNKTSDMVLNDDQARAETIAGSERAIRLLSRLSSYNNLDGSFDIGFWKEALFNNPGNYTLYKGLIGAKSVPYPEDTSANPAELLFSSEAGTSYRAIEAFDTGDGTFWRSVSTANEYLGWDFGEYVCIDEIQLAGRNSSTLPVNIKVQRSTDNTTWYDEWTAVVPSDSYISFSNEKIARLYGNTRSQGRYWRVMMLDNGGASYIELVRFNMLSAN